MSNFFFTKSELHKMHVDDLKKLANYFEAKYPDNIKKDKLIDLVYDGQMKWLRENSFSPTDEPAKMSVKVQRIYDELRKEK